MSFLNDELKAFVPRDPRAPALPGNKNPMGGTHVTGCVYGNERSKIGIRSPPHNYSPEISATMRRSLSNIIKQHSSRLHYSEILIPTGLPHSKKNRFHFLVTSGRDVTESFNEYIVHDKRIGEWTDRCHIK